MAETIVLQGKKYTGTFQGEVKFRSGEYIRSCDHYCDLKVEYAFHWWDVYATIQEGEKIYPFRFRTSDYTPAEFSNESLYDNILMFEKREEYPSWTGVGTNLRKVRVKPQILKSKEKVIDILLENIVQRIQASNEVIPKVAPQPIDTSDLIEQGLVAEENGQIRLNLITPKQI